MAEVDVELMKGVDELCLLAEQRPKLVGRERARAVTLAPGEFCLACDGGLIDPASGDGL